MSTADLVQEAIDELYGLDPDEFMQRRTSLAADARTTDKAAAKDIAALRKPTRSAYALNRLVRADPDAAQRLADLGDELRAAQDALDGARMRELSTLRRGMVEELADQAFEVIAQRSPPPALREEVVSTMNAAVADEGVAQQLGTGTLLRSTRWDGFGFASPPELSVVRPGAANDRRGRGQAVRPGAANDRRGRGQAVRPASPRSREQPSRAKVGAAKTGSARAGATRAGSKQAAAATRGRSSAEARAAAKAQAAAQARAQAKAEEQLRRQALADARRTVKDADSTLDKATRAEEQQVTRVRLLHEQLTDARRRLDELRIDLRRAENRQRKAQQALDRTQA